MGFKHDEMFLQYLTMGAVGSARVASHLNTHGHRMTELERYTAANKIWATKVKRLRLPDLICVRCGVRVEARGKSKLEIRLSDSPGVPGRQWDAGMDADDLVAFVRVSWDGKSATASGALNYFRVGDLRSTIDLSRLGPPKSAGEGAERDRTWPATAPSYDGEVTRVEHNYVTIRRPDGRSRRTTLREGNQHYVREGDAFLGGERLIAGVVPLPPSVTCAGDGWTPIADATSADPGRRYAAVKVMGLRGEDPTTVERLSEIWRNDGEDYRIRLEALAGLARSEPGSWIDALVQQADEVTVDMAMETVLILSELPVPEAATGLRMVLADESHASELRAAAAWGLGPGGVHNDTAGLVPYLSDMDDSVVRHTVVAMGRELNPEILQLVADGITAGDRAAAAATQVLIRNGKAAANVLLTRLRGAQNVRERSWALFALGSLGREVVESCVTYPLPADVAGTLEVLWTGVGDNWVTGDQVMELEFLERQTIRESLIMSGTSRTNSLADG